MKRKLEFLFFFSNDQNRSLQLEKEWRETESALRLAEKHINYNLTPSTTKDDIWAKLNHYHNRIALLHFGGHSDAEGLSLNDKDLEGKRLATLLGQEKTLKLLFLNGCNNKGQIKEYFTQGVPAVIATSVSIQDKRALDFSIQFYKALSRGKSLKQAFDTAAAYVNDRQEKSIFGCRGFERLPEKDPIEFEWGLYVKDERVLDWRINMGTAEENTTNIRWSKRLIWLTSIAGLGLFVAFFIFNFWRNNQTLTGLRNPSSPLSKDTISSSLAGTNSREIAEDDTSSIKIQKDIHPEPSENTGGISNTFSTENIGHRTPVENPISVVDKRENNIGLTEIPSTVENQNNDIKGFNVSGIVKDSLNHPLEGVVVSLQNTNGRIVRDTTNQYGNFELILNSNPEAD
ncbi:MAG: carboxypeptidase-like regulatory domain-containing protein, partial [Bacteroidota bacterium]